MDDLNLPPSFEQTSVYRLASAWLNSDEIREALEWLLPLTDPDPEQRRVAVFAMSQRREQSIRVPLLVALHDPDERVRVQAAHAITLARFRDARAVEPLHAMLRDADLSSRST